MAERDEPGIAHEHVEPKCKDGVDQNLADDVDVVAVDDPQRHGDERQKRERERDPPSHGACLPNRPCGRMSKMTSIGRKPMMKLPSSAPNRLPVPPRMTTMSASGSMSASRPG